MALTHGQISVRGFVMGANTSYTVDGFNPWSRQARADQGGSRAWNDGSWSGAEWQDEAVVPMVVFVEAADLAGWITAQQTMTAAFAPASTDVELRWAVGSTEYVMFGRPRIVEPAAGSVGLGWSLTRAAFVALNPTVYSGVEHLTTLALPLSSAGLTVPITPPFTVDATTVAGRVNLTNAGTATTGLTLRITGPVQEPRVSVLVAGVSSVLRIMVTLTAGQWLDVDTAARTVYLNGTASRRGLAVGQWPLLPSGTYEFAFDAAVYDAAAQVEIRWRDAWY